MQLPDGTYILWHQYNNALVGRVERKHVRVLIGSMFEPSDHGVAPIGGWVPQPDDENFVRNLRECEILCPCCPRFGHAAALDMALQMGGDWRHHYQMLRRQP